MKVSESIISPRPEGRRLQIADQTPKRFLIQVVVFPVAEVIVDKILANLAGGIFSGIGVEALPIAQAFKRSEPDGEQCAQGQQQLVMEQINEAIRVRR